MKRNGDNCYLCKYLLGMGDSIGMSENLQSYCFVKKNLYIDNKKHMSIHRRQRQLINFGAMYIEVGSSSVLKNSKLIDLKVTKCFNSNLFSKRYILQVLPRTRFFE